MQEAVPVGVGAMAAILGMELEKVTAVCQDAAQGGFVRQPTSIRPNRLSSPETLLPWNEEPSWLMNAVRNERRSFQSALHSIAL